MGEKNYNTNAISQSVNGLGGVSFSNQAYIEPTEGRGSVHDNIRNIDETVAKAKGNLNSVNSKIIVYLKNVNKTLEESEDAIIKMINGQ
jgi:predicted KAP-like P-loop ATPase